MICHFSCKNECKKEKSLVSFMHEQNIICSQTQLDDIAHEQTIICRQLFAGHMLGFWPVKRKKNLHRITKEIIGLALSTEYLLHNWSVIHSK